VSTLILWVLAYLPSRPPEKRKRPGREGDKTEQSLDEHVDARAKKQKDARALTHHTPITPDHY
jgi:hypothetical protein